MMKDGYHFLAITNLKYKRNLSTFNAIYLKNKRFIRYCMQRSNTIFSRGLQGFPSSYVEEPINLNFTYDTLKHFLLS